MKYLIAYWQHLSWQDSLILAGLLFIAACIVFCVFAALLDRQTRQFITGSDLDKAYRNGQFSVGRDTKKL